MNPGSRLAKGAALAGGGLGVGLVLISGIGQLDLSNVVRGNLPLRTAIALSGNAFPFLLVLLLVCLVGLIIALPQKVNQVWAGLLWLCTAGVIAYCVYLSRFSIGPLLIPSVALFIIAGLIALWPQRR
jgi:hypothetical protein